MIAGRQVLRQVLLGTATGAVSGIIIGTESNKHQVNLEGFIVPGLGRHLSFTAQPAKTGISTIIDSRHRLEQLHHVMSLHQLNINLELLSFNIESSEDTRNDVAITAIRLPADN